MADFNTFVKKLYDEGYFEVDSDGSSITWVIKKFTENPSWPEGLATENFEITHIGDDKISGYSCGDWQEGTTFSIELQDDKLVFIPFDPVKNDSKVVLKHKRAEMAEIVNSNIKAIKEANEMEYFYKQLHQVFRKYEGENYGFGRGEARHGEENVYMLYIRGKDGVQATITVEPTDRDVTYKVRCLGFVSDEMSTTSTRLEADIDQTIHSIVVWLKEKFELTEASTYDENGNLTSIKESAATDTKTIKKLFNEFNKEFFNNELPDVEIKITNKDTDHSKGVAGSFNFHKSIHTNNGENKHYKLADLKKEKNLDGEAQRALDYIKGNAYIELPKDIVEKGKYYYASVLLHEMVHEYIEFCTNSHESDCHGPDFKRKVDEINKKSKNEWRVAYEEVPPELTSDKPLDERPEDLPESKDSFWSAYYKKGLNKLSYNK